MPTASEWERIYDEADRQAIVGLLLTGLECLPAEQLPTVSVKLLWIGIVQIMEATHRQYGDRAKELTCNFRSVGFVLYLERTQ